MSEHEKEHRTKELVLHLLPTFYDTFAKVCRNKGLNPVHIIVRLMEAYIEEENASRVSEVYGNVAERSNGAKGQA